MIWKDYSSLKGKHSFLAPSSSSTWKNYDDEKLVNRYYNSFATTIGTLLHELAADMITNKTRCAKSDQKWIRLLLKKNNIPISAIDNMDMLMANFMAYVNDGISYNLSTEILLYYSDICFGTADAIGFDNNFLRIHDYKSGVTPAHMEQLETYAALFCLDYNINPRDIQMELRLYQSGDIIEYKPTAEDIAPVIRDITHKNKIIQSLK